MSGRRLKQTEAGMNRREALKGVGALGASAILFGKFFTPSLARADRRRTKTPTVKVKDMDHLDKETERKKYRDSTSGKDYIIDKDGYTQAIKIKCNGSDITAGVFVYHVKGKQVNSEAEIRARKNGRLLDKHRRNIADIAGKYKRDFGTDLKFVKLVVEPFTAKDKVQVWVVPVDSPTAKIKAGVYTVCVMYANGATGESSVCKVV